MPQVKKLSTATVFGKVDLRKLLSLDGKPLPVMRVVGQAIEKKSGTSSYGDWTALLGQFKATNLETKQEYEGSTLFLPDVALVPLLVGLAQDGSRGVMFAIDIFAVEAKDVKPGGSPYEYTFENVLPPAENDPIRAMESRILALTNNPGTDPATGETPAPAPVQQPKGRAKGAK